MMNPFATTCRCCGCTVCARSPVTTSRMLEVCPDGRIGPYQIDTRTHEVTHPYGGSYGRVEAWDVPGGVIDDAYPTPPVEAM